MFLRSFCRQVLLWSLFLQSYENQDTPNPRYFETWDRPFYRNSNIFWIQQEKHNCNIKLFCISVFPLLNNNFKALYCQSWAHSRFVFNVTGNRLTRNKSNLYQLIFIWVAETGTSNYIVFRSEYIFFLLLLRIMHHISLESWSTWSYKLPHWILDSQSVKSSFNLILKRKKRKNVAICFCLISMWIQRTTGQEARIVRPFLHIHLAVPMRLKRKWFPVVTLKGKRKEASQKIYLKFQPNVSLHLFF